MIAVLDGLDVEPLLLDVEPLLLDVEPLLLDVEPLLLGAGVTRSQPAAVRARLLNERSP